MNDTLQSKSFDKNTVFNILSYTLFLKIPDVIFNLTKNTDSFSYDTLLYITHAVADYNKVDYNKTLDSVIEHLDDNETKNETTLNKMNNNTPQTFKAKTILGIISNELNLEIPDKITEKTKNVDYFTYDDAKETISEITNWNGVNFHNTFNTVVQLYEKLNNNTNGTLLSTITNNTDNNNTDNNNTVTNDNYEQVNHPSHYNNYGKEVIDMMESIWGTEKLIAFCEMNAFKYRMRMGTKPDNPIQQDIEKEKWYLNKAKQLKNKLKQTDNS